MSESKTPSIDQCCKTSVEDLCKSALSHYEDISAKACHWSNQIPQAIEFWYLQKPKLEAELSRYREAEKALPEEPLSIRKMQTYEWKLGGYVCGDISCKEVAVYIDKLRAHAAAVQAERDEMREWERMVAVALGVPGCNAAEMLNVIDSMREDAKLGGIAIRFVDRAGDVCEQTDPAEKICQEFYEAMSAAIAAARKETP